MKSDISFGDTQDRPGNPPKDASFDATTNEHPLLEALPGKLAVASYEQKTGHLHFAVGAIDYTTITRAGFALCEARGIVGAELRVGICVAELFAVDDASSVSLCTSNFGATYDPSMARQSSGRVPRDANKQAF
jgi:hypothetical protein